MVCGELEMLALSTFVQRAYEACFLDKQEAHKQKLKNVFASFIFLCKMSF